MTTPTTGTETSLNLQTLDIRGLRARVAGPVLTPGTEDYDLARQLHDFSFQRFPALIVRAANAADVAEAVRFGRASNLPIAVKSGGHSVSGLSSVDGGLMIDLSDLRSFTIDPETRILRAQPGATSGEIGWAANQYGLALPTGDTETVGLGGLTLGGGIGWLTRKHGLTVDRLRSVSLVTAEGERITASATGHPDLFWALRGGGGNFGIVTEFEYELVPTGTVLGGAILLPATRENVERYAEYALHAPDELTTIAQIMLAPPAPFVPEEKIGTLSLVVMLVYDGDIEEGERVVAPIRAIDTPVAEAVGPMPYPGIYALTEVPAMRHGAAVRSNFMDELSPDLIDTWIEAVGEGGDPLRFLQLRPLGGQMARVPGDTTAFPHRRRNFLTLIVGAWLDPADDGSTHTAWALDLWERTKSYGRGVYVNFVADEGEARVRNDAYGESTYRRLADVKRRYDPENVFALNQNIKPA